jgi:hypothetical protein
MLDHTREALAVVVPRHLPRDAPRRLPRTRGGRMDATSGHSLLLVRRGSGSHRREEIQGVLRRDPEAAGRRKGGEGERALAGGGDLRVAGPWRQSLQHVLQESDDHTRRADGRGREAGGGAGQGRRERDRRHGTIEGHRTVDRGHMGRVGEGPVIEATRQAGARQGEGHDLGILLGDIPRMEAREEICRHGRAVPFVGGHCLGVAGTVLLLRDWWLIPMMALRSSIRVNHTYRNTERDNHTYHEEDQSMPTGSAAHFAPRILPCLWI